MCAWPVLVQQIKFGFDKALRQRELGLWCVFTSHTDALHSVQAHAQG